MAFDKYDVAVIIVKIVYQDIETSRAMTLSAKFINDHEYQPEKDRHDVHTWLVDNLTQSILVVKLVVISWKYSISCHQFS